MKPRAKHKWSEIKHLGLNPERIASAEENVEKDSLAIRLQIVREAAGLNQRELGKKAKISQSQLSRLEIEGNAEITTIIRYLAAAGARLEMTAVLKNGKTVPLIHQPSKERLRTKTPPTPLKSAGWVVGNATDFLGLSSKEQVLVDRRLEDAEDLRIAERRLKKFRAGKTKSIPLSKEMKDFQGGKGKTRSTTR